MSAYDRALREIREETADQIPEYAINLEEDPFAIRSAILAALDRRGFTSQDTTESDLNKAERTAISGWAISEQHRHIVLDHGREAQFLPHIVRSGLNAFPGAEEERASQLYSLAIGRALNFGAIKVAQVYSGGHDAEHQCWPILTRHYKKLGKLALQLTGGGEAVPLEATNLHEAVRSHALGNSLQNLAFVIRRDFDADTEERLTVAHDLAYLPKLLSVHHIVGATAAFNWWKRLDGEIKQDKRGKYRFVANNRLLAAKLWRNPSDLPDANLQCAAWVDNVLEDYIHAGINMMPAYRLL